MHGLAEAALEVDGVVKQGLLQIRDPLHHLLVLLSLLLEFPRGVLGVFAPRVLEHLDLLLRHVVLALEVLNFKHDGLVPILVLLELVLEVVHVNLHFVLQLNSLTI